MNLLQLEPGENVNTVIPLAEGLAGAGQFLFMVTRNGTVKKTPVAEFANIRASGLKAIKLEEGDELISALLTDGECDILVGTRRGQALRFHERHVRSMHRASSGVRGIRLRGEDTVVEAVIVDEDAEMLCITERGCGKRVEFSEFPSKKRGGLGIKALKVTEKTGVLVALRPVFDLNDVMLISSDGTIIRIAAADVSTLSRIAQGVRVMRLREGDSVVAVEVAERGEADEVELAELPEDTGEFDTSGEAEAEDADETDDNEESEDVEEEDETSDDESDDGE